MNYTNAHKNDREIALKALGLSMVATFVPFTTSKDINKLSSNDLCLNWKISLKKDGRSIYSFPYTQGIGHAPYYKTIKGFKDSVYNFNPLLSEAVTGKVFGTHFAIPAPCLVDVCYSIAMDASSGRMDFEDFCSEFGYDSDSRKAKKIHKACKKAYLRVGEVLTDKINNICEGY